MSRVIIIAGLLLSFCLSACKRESTSSTTSQGTGAEASNGTNRAAEEGRSLLEKGKLLYRDDQDAEAADAFKHAVSLDPTLAEAHFRLGLAYEALNKAEEAEASYKKAVETYKKYLADNNEDGEAHYNLGQTYAGLQQYSDAIREFRQAVKIKSEDPDIYYDMGMAHTKLAQYSEAAAAFSKSLELDPEYYRAQDALDEAREGVKRIKAGRKHQEDLIKKAKEEELKKAGTASPTATPTKPAVPKGQ